MEPQQCTSPSSLYFLSLETNHFSSLKFYHHLQKAQSPSVPCNQFMSLWDSSLLENPDHGIVTFPILVPSNYLFSLSILTDKQEFPCEGEQVQWVWKCGKGGWMGGTIREESYKVQASKVESQGLQSQGGVRVKWKWRFQQTQGLWSHPLGSDEWPQQSQGWERRETMSQCQSPFTGGVIKAGRCLHPRPRVS